MTSIPVIVIYRWVCCGTPGRNHNIGVRFTVDSAIPVNTVPLTTCVLIDRNRNILLQMEATEANLKGWHGLNELVVACDELEAHQNGVDVGLRSTIVIPWTKAEQEVLNNHPWPIPYDEVNL